ncbi:hypothetical protein BGZ61DRAFT_465708 [Ilyonectria robusta]|uniref:uncharacterized protein n=1 Tax=Ilyonectria robusta TaxID=1079257 RepID=UPI001E8E9A18|nr:uncharacterized protein BGZ61DRAFT_465708 [Ilyonectria robusta]KAH8658918.1 hypothetical protein BGZ61DRAFT_465708 [Ilyonectria robusta]
MTPSQMAPDHFPRTLRSSAELLVIIPLLLAQPLSCSLRQTRPTNHICGCPDGQRSAVGQQLLGPVLWPRHHGE